MKIKSALLRQFIQKASLGGTIMAINLDFSELGVLSSVRSMDNVVLTKSFLKTEAFEDYEQFGEIFIKNTAMLLNYLGTFKDIVLIEKVEEYIIKISDGERDGFVILGSELVCDNVMRDKEPEIKTTSTIDMKKEYLTKSLKDMNTLTMTKLTINKTENDLLFEIGAKGESDYFVNKFKVDSDGDATVSVGEKIINLYNVLSSEFKLSIGTNLPLVIEEETEFIKFKCLIAPVVENE